MSQPHRPARPSFEPSEPPHVGERRGGDRSRLSLFWNLFYKGIRAAGGHAGSFYSTVGIFLVAGTALAIAGILAFAKLAQVVRGGATQAFDVAVLEYIHARHTPLATKILVEVTHLGTGIVVLVIVAVAAMLLWHTEHKHSARLLLATTIGSIILNNAVKLVFDRERPSVFEWGATAASSSFPSGHAMSATVVYGTVAYLAARLQKHRISRVLTMLGAAIMIAAICFTRLYLGVHYPTDVLGGVIFGLAWAGFCMATLEALLVIARRRAPAQTAAEERPAAKEIEQGTAAPV